MKLPTSNPFLSTITALAALVAAPLAHAADGTWTGTTGNWTDAGTWSGGIPADGADFTAFFTGANIIADQTITLGVNRTIGNITFTDDTTASNNLTITGNTLTLDRTDAIAPTINVTQTGRQLTIASIIAGNDGLQKIGAGTLTFKGTNTFSGGLTIKAGSVTSDGAGSGGNFLGSGTVTIGDSANTGTAANLNFNGSNFTSTNAISVVGNGASSISVSGWSQILNGAITLSNNLSVITNNAYGSTLTFGGGVTGTGNLVIQSNAAMIGSNASKILFQTGALNMVGSITNSGAGSTGTPGNIDTTISSVIGTNVTGVTQNSANSALILSGANTFTGNITISAGTLNANLKQTVNNPTSGALGNPSTAGRQVTIASGGALNFSQIDVLGQGGTGNTLLTLIANGGTIRNNIDGVNTLGPVQLNGGTLTSTAVTVGNGFRLTGTVTVGGSAVSTISASTGTGTIVSSGVITYDVADAVVGSGSDLNVTAVLGALYGSGGIIKTGAGTMTLSNTNTYTGTTTVNAGTLLTTKAAALPGYNSSAKVIFNGGTVGVQVGGAGWTTGQVDTLLTNATKTSGALGIDTSNGNLTQWTTFTTTNLGSSLGLTKLGSNTLTLDQANTYNGTTIISGGTLKLGASGSIASSPTVIIGANTTFDVSAVTGGYNLSGTQTLSGTGTVTGAMTVSGTLSPGNSPGIMPTGNQTWLDDGDYNFQILDAAGSAGSGFDQIQITGTLSLASLTAGGFAINLWSLSSTGPDVNGNALNFNNTINQSWTILTTSGGISGFEATDFLVNVGANNGTGGFSNALGGGSFSIDATSNNLVLNYTAVPEPGAALIGSLGLLALLRRRR